MQRTLSLIAVAVRWMLNHWLIVLLASTAASMAFVKRRRIVDRWNTVLWEIAPSTTAGGRVLQTVRLIDYRLQLAGLPRPSALTLTKWLQQQPELNSASPVLYEFLSLADWAAYGNPNASNAVLLAVTEECCHRIQRDLTLAGFQRAALTGQVRVSISRSALALGFRGRFGPNRTLARSG